MNKSKYHSSHKQPSPPYLIGHSSPHEQGTAVLQVKGLEFRYNGDRVLQDIDFELKTGERVAVVGPNGAGKSTLFKVIAGILPPASGMVQIYGHEPGGHICIAYVPQRSQVDWNFPANVLDVAMMGRVRRIGLFRWPSLADRRAVQNALKVVSMTQLANRQISELSGGQQQRVFIARSLAQEAELMLMDEPLNGLDIPSQEEIFRILEELRQQHVTVMVAMHDLQMAAERFDRVMLLNRRLIGLGKAEDVFSPQNLVDAYGGHLRLVTTENGTIVVEDTCCDEGGHHHD
ncbi:MAG: metal ABC transporter ATP-binding protein [Anaerolineales bacterium]|nr:metal ABC transporter ATP-binding protein [Anaerolineales bacterium]